MIPSPRKFLMIHHLHRPFLLSSPCLRSSLLIRRTSTSSLTSRILPRNLLPTSSRPPRRPQKTKPLPLKPSKPPSSHRRRQFAYYTFLFLLSTGITYTTLSPDNIVNHFISGFLRCSRVTICLAHCVFDYRMTMRHQLTEAESDKEMSECHLRCARRALRVFEKNGGIYIKLGQHLAALSYLIPIVPQTMTFLILGMGIYDGRITRFLSSDFNVRFRKALRERYGPCSLRRLFQL